MNEQRMHTTQTEGITMNDVTQPGTSVRRSNVAVNIGHAIEQRGWTRHQLASAACLDVRVVSRAMLGLAIRLSSTRAIAEALGVLYWDLTLPPERFVQAWRAAQERRIQGQMAAFMGQAHRGTWRGRVAGFFRRFWRVGAHENK